MKIFFKKILHGINVILVISLIIVCGIHVKRRMDGAISSFQNRRKERRDEVERVKSVTRVVTPGPQKELKWELFWIKPPYVSGLNPKMRTLEPNEVSILTNNVAVFAFTLFYKHEGKRKEAHFFWDKTKRYGVWSQTDPKGEGLWWLAPEPGSNNRYQGVVLDRLTDNKFVNMCLVGR